MVVDFEFVSVGVGLALMFNASADSSFGRGDFEEVPGTGGFPACDVDRGIADEMESGSCTLAEIVLEDDVGLRSGWERVKAKVFPYPYPPVPSESGCDWMGVGRNGGWRVAVDLVEIGSLERAARVSGVLVPEIYGRARCVKLEEDIPRGVEPRAKRLVEAVLAALLPRAGRGGKGLA